MENWKTIVGYSHYEVSSLGRIRHVKFKKYRKFHLDRRGYTRIRIPDDFGKLHTLHLGRVLAEAFIVKPIGSQAVDHINRIRNDNRLENLRWVTYSENMRNRTPAKRGAIPKHIIKSIVGLFREGKTEDEIYRFFLVKTI